MALVECVECGEQISDEAAACPHCGFSGSSDDDDGGCLSGCGKVVGVVFAAVVVLWLVAFATMKSEDSGERHLDRLEAINACQDAVESRLKAPSTADFVDESFERTFEGTAEVIGQVDAENSYGASLRSQYMCTLEESAGSLEVIDVTVE